MGEAVEGLGFAKNGVEVARFRALGVSEPLGARANDGCGGQLLDADGGQRAARLMGEGAQGAGDIGEAKQAGQGDGEVAQSSHHGRPVADADARAVLIEGDIPYVVGAVLDPPLAAVEGEQFVGISLGRCQAGDGKDGLVASLAGLQFRDLALDAADLRDMGEVDVVVEGRAGEQTPLLQAAVTLIEGLGAQGGNAPASMPGGRHRGWADSP